MLLAMSMSLRNNDDQDEPHAHKHILYVIINHAFPLASPRIKRSRVSSRRARAQCGEYFSFQSRQHCQLQHIQTTLPWAAAGFFMRAWVSRTPEGVP